MPRVTHVKSAQQRYKTVPVLDAEGNPVRTPVIDKRTGVQKTSKRGPVFMTKTVADKSQPLPLLDCDFPGCTINDRKIAIGSAYMHISPKSGPYGGLQRNRHAEHPSWQPWEYSSSTSARVAQVQHEAGDLISTYEFSSYDDFDDLRDQVAQMAQELLDEKQESLDNMPEGLADGSQIEEQVQALESWVEAIEGVDAPDQPDPEPTYKWFVTGPDQQSLNEDGYEDEDAAQADLDAHLAEHEDESEDDWSIDSEEVEDEADETVDEDWMDEARQAIQDALDDCQV
jgi:hypothetical protein